MRGEERGSRLDALVNGRLLVGGELATGRALLLEDGRIRAVLPRADVPSGAAIHDLGGHLLAPGFIDLQVNGGGGVLLNEAPTVETIATIGRAHRRYGTTGFLPTLISTDRQTMARAAGAVRDALGMGVPGVLGIHFEGPHLNPARRGVHDARHLRPLNAADLELLASLGAGRTLVTLAPECVPPERIRALCERGVVVSAGHTDASYEQLQEAVQAGISGFTHLFNAMGQLGSRAPGAVGGALALRECRCGIIVDLVHVHPASVRIAWQAKPRGELFLVTDAMAPVGAEMEEFRLGEQRVQVRDDCCVAADGRLAGSTLDMAGAVRRAVQAVGIPLEEALCMASTYPAEFIGLGRERGRIAPGLAADLVLLDDDLHVRATWIAGEPEWLEAAA